MPTARAQAAIAVDHGGAIHVMGGYITGSTEVTNHDVLYVDGGWASLAPLPTPSRAAVAATGPDGVIYYVGGYASNQLNTLYAFGADGGWSTLAPATPPDASVPGPGWETAGDFGADGKLYVFGGEGDELSDAGSNLGSTNSRTMIYDPASNTWSIGARMPARRKQHRALRGSDGNIYILGGQSDVDVATNTVFVYHPASDTWTQGPPIAVVVDGGDAGVPINSFAVAASPDRSLLFVAGGSTAYGNGSSPFFSDLYVFDVGGQSWTKLAMPLPLGRRELVAAFQTCDLHVLGGSNGGPVTEHDVATLLSGGACQTSFDGGVSDAGAGDSGAGDASSTDGSVSDGGGADGSASDAALGGDAGGTGGTVDSGLGGGSPGESDSGADGGAGGGSDGCGCSFVGADSSTGFAAVNGLGILALAVLRGRRRRS